MAARYYSDALELGPRRPGLWVLYGNAVKEAGIGESVNLAAAERAYRISLDLNSGNADAHLQLGHVLKLQGRKSEAGQAYLRALQLAPGFGIAEELQALGLPAEVG